MAPREQAGGYAQTGGIYPDRDVDWHSIPSFAEHRWTNHAEVSVTATNPARFEQPWR